MRTKMGIWRTILFLAMGLAIATAICMKWLEHYFIIDGKRFTILGLELFYDQAELNRVYGGMNEPVRVLLRFHCRFDYVFMAGVYPAIAAGCILAAFRTSGLAMTKVLHSVAMCQVLAWVCDGVENYFLLRWIRLGMVDDQLLLFHVVSVIKWVIALTGVLLLIVQGLRRKNRVEI